MHLFWKKIEKREVNFFFRRWIRYPPLVLKIFFFLSNVKFAQKNEKKVKILESIKNLEIRGYLEHWRKNLLTFPFCCFWLKTEIRSIEISKRKFFSWKKNIFVVFVASLNHAKSWFLMDFHVFFLSLKHA